MSAVMAVAIAVSLVSQASGTTVANSGYSYTFTANGVNNTVNWNDYAFGNFYLANGAVTAPNSNADAFDNGAIIDLCTTSGCTYNSGTYNNYNAVGTAATSTVYQGALMTNIVPGLNATVSYKFSTTSAAMRVLVQLDNSTASAITRTVRLRAGLGCDGGCYLKYQSSGGSTISNYFDPVSSSYTTSSFWTITTDQSAITSSSSGTDAIVSMAYGTAGAAIAPSTTITNSNTDNIFTTMDPTIPANSTRYLVFVVGLAGVSATTNKLIDAYNGVSTYFGSWWTLPSDLRSDLDSTQLSQILNWAVGPNAYANVNISLTASATTAVKGTNITITAIVNQAGVVTFFWNGKKIPGCIKRMATTSASCQWKPNVTGSWSIQALLDPNDFSYYDTYSSKLPIFIISRANNR